FACEVAAWCHEEDDHEEAYYVESRQERCEQRHSENRRVAFVGERKNCVLAEKPAEWRTADQRQRANNKTNKRDRKFLGKPSHIPDVLFVMEHHNHRAGSEEEKRFKECMGKQVEHGRIIRRKTHRHHHVTKL